MVVPASGSGQEASSKHRRVVKGAVVSLIVLSAVIQLAIPPLVGLANNGDFAKLAGRFSLAPAPAPDSDLMHGYYISRLTFHPSHYWDSGFFSSALIPIWLAVNAGRLVLSRAWFDMRVLAMTYLLIAAFAAWILLTAADRLPASGRWTLYVMAALALADVGYVAYFSSFYGEPATFVFGLGFIACVLLSIERPARASFAGAVVFLILFAAAKPQNVASAALFLPLGFRLGKKLPDRRSRIAFMAGLALALMTMGIGSWRLPKKNLIEVTYYASVFSEILMHSPDPHADLRQLGLEPSLSRLAGTSPFEPRSRADEMELRSGFYGRVSYLQILRFYLNHPRRLWGVIDRCSKSALLVRPESGNFEKRSGFPRFTQSQTFNLWHRVHVDVLPSSGAGLGFILSGWLAAAVYLHWKSQSQRERLHIEWFVTLLAMAAVQMLVVAVCHGGFVDTSRHLFLFAMLFDVCLGYVFVWLMTSAAPVAERAMRTAVDRRSGNTARERRSLPPDRLKPSRLGLPGGAPPEPGAVH